MSTPAELLHRELRRDPTRPMLTWYDDGSGERVELSVATTANWAAKIAGLLVDDYDVAAGDAVGVRLPLHWETAVVLLGIWTAGAAASVAHDGDAVTFATRGAPPQPGGETVELSLEPLGAGLARLVGGQPDSFAGHAPPDLSAPALHVAGRSWTHGELGIEAARAAAGHDLGVGSRVLSTLGLDTADGIDAGLLGLLAAGASAVLVSHADRARLEERCAVERVTHTAGVTVAGLPRLDA